MSGLFYQLQTEQPGAELCRTATSFSKNHSSLLNVLLSSALTRACSHSVPVGSTIRNYKKRDSLLSNIIVPWEVTWQHTLSFWVCTENTGAHWRLRVKYFVLTTLTLTPELIQRRPKKDLLVPNLRTVSNSVFCSSFITVSKSARSPMYSPANRLQEGSCTPATQCFSLGTASITTGS